MKAHGATLIELMITLVIAGILVAMAIPAYNMYVQNMRALTLSSDFAAALAFARNEAITRGSPVTLCASASAAMDTCGGNTSWTNGWIVFVDPESDGVISNNAERLQVHDALEFGTTFTSNQSRVTYSAIGFATNGIGTYNLSAPGCTGNHGRTVTLSAAGRANVAQAAC